MNNYKIWPNKRGSAHKIHVSWLYYGDIKIRDTFVYKHILASGASAQDLVGASQVEKVFNKATGPPARPRALGFQPDFEILRYNLQYPPAKAHEAWSEAP